MNRFVAPNITAQPTQETAALPARGAADLGMSLIIIYELWLATWETALAALATATRSRALSTNEAAAHSAVINAERELVTKHFTLLLGPELPLRRARDNSSIRTAKEPFDVRRAQTPIGLRPPTRTVALAAERSNRQRPGRLRGRGDGARTAARADDVREALGVGADALDGQPLRLERRRAYVQEVDLLLDRVVGVARFSIFTTLSSLGLGRAAPASRSLGKSRLERFERAPIHEPPQEVKPAHVPAETFQR